MTPFSLLSTVIFLSSFPIFLLNPFTDFSLFPLSLGEKEAQGNDGLCFCFYTLSLRGNAMWGGSRVTGRHGSARRGNIAPRRRAEEEHSSNLAMHRLFPGDRLLRARSKCFLAQVKY